MFRKGKTCKCKLLLYTYGLYTALFKNLDACFDSFSNSVYVNPLFPQDGAKTRVLYVLSTIHGYVLQRKHISYCQVLPDKFPFNLSFLVDPGCILVRTAQITPSVETLWPCMFFNTMIMSSSRATGEGGLSSPSETSEDAFLFLFFAPTRVIVLLRKRKEKGQTYIQLRATIKKSL